MKKFLYAITAIMVLACAGQYAMTEGAAPFPTGVGGTGTSTTPLSGQVLIGNAAGTYTPAYILCAGTCTVATSSGGITITGTGVANNAGNWAGTWQLFNPSDFLSSSTVKVISVNGLSGVVTISSSSLGVVWPTVNGNQATNYNIVPGTGVTSTVSGATTTISVSLNNGATQTCSANTFVNSITSSGTTNCGSITFPTAPTYTFSAGTGTSVSQATSSSNTTTTITLNINGGTTQTCTAGQLQNSLSGLGLITCQIAVQSIGNVNTSSISFVVNGGATLATTTNSITITAGKSNVSTSTANTWTVLQTFTGLFANGTTTLASTTNALLLTDGSGNVSGFAGSTCSAGNAPRGVSATGTVQNCTAFLTGNQSITLTISGDATGTASGATSINDSLTVTGLLGKALPSLATGTLEYTAGAWTFAPLTTPSTYTFQAGTGLTVSQASSTSNTTTTYTNTGVTSFTGAGCATAANSTGTVTLSVTCISGNQSITFTINGDATGTASGTTSITDSITVTGLNGKALPANATGTLQYSGGAWAINLATSSLGVYNASGVLSSYLGSTCGGGQFVTGFSATGTVACGTPGGGGTLTQLTAGTGISFSPSSPITATGTITNTGVTQLNAGGCVTVSATTTNVTLGSNCVTSVTGSNGIVVTGTTAPNVGLASSTASGTILIGTGNGQWAIALPTSTSPLTWTYGSGTLSIGCASCQTANQTITITATGDATGTASGSTSITHNLTVTGLQGHALPAVATGTLQYTGGAWALNNATSSLGLYSSAGVLSSYGGASTCANSGLVSTISATGGTTCVSSSSEATVLGLSNYSTSTGANPTATISTSTQNGSANTFMRSDAAPAFSQSLGYTFSALGNTTSTANISALSFIDASPTGTASYFANNNGYLGFPTTAQLAAGANCGGATADTDAGACVNHFYALDTSSTPITVPPNQTYNFTTPIAATGSQMLALSCAAGSGDVFNYTGTTSSVIAAVHIDTTSFGSSYDHVAGSEIDNCLFKFPTSTLGLQVGGSLVTPHVRFNNVTTYGGGPALNLASNTYDFEATNIVQTNASGTVLINSANNSGEGIKFFNPWWADPTDSSSSNCIVLQSSAVASFAAIGGSLDNCGVNVGVGNIQVSFGYMHDEDPDYGFDAPYYRFTGTSDTVTHLSLDHMTFYLDNTTSSANNKTSLVDCPSVCDIEDSSVAKTAGSGGIANVVGNTTNGSAIVTVQNILVPNLGVASNTMHMGTPGILPIGGIYTSNANSYTGGCSETSGNIYQCINNGNSFGIDISGGIRTNTFGAPTATDGAGAASVLSNSNDSAGRIQITTSTASIILTFATAFTQAPSCIGEIQSGTIVAFGATELVGSSTFTTAANMATNTIMQYICIGH